MPIWSAFIALLFITLVRISSGQEDEKAAVKIVVHDRIRGFLNWLQPWFLEAAKNQCSTRCILTEDKGQMRNADMVVYHAPTHTGDHKT